MKPLVLVLKEIEEQSQIYPNFAAHYHSIQAAYDKRDFEALKQLVLSSLQPITNLSSDLMLASISYSEKLAEN